MSVGDGGATVAVSVARVTQHTRRARAPLLADLETTLARAQSITRCARAVGHRRRAVLGRDAEVPDPPPDAREARGVDVETRSARAHPTVTDAVANDDSAVEVKVTRVPHLSLGAREELVQVDVSRETGARPLVAVGRGQAATLGVLCATVPWQACNQPTQKGISFTRSPIVDTGNGVAEHNSQTKICFAKDLYFSPPTDIFVGRTEKNRMRLPPWASWCRREDGNSPIGVGQAKGRAGWFRAHTLPSGFGDVCPFVFSCTEIISKDGHR